MKTNSKTLEALRNRLKSSDEPVSASINTFKVSSMAIGDTARIRFIPNPSNPSDLFWVQQSLINLEFPGTTEHPNQPHSARIVAIPEIIEINRGLWKTDEAIARKFYPKKSYITQAIVKSYPSDKTLDGQLVRITISPQLYTVIRAAVLDPDLDYLPCDIGYGLDFNIIKTQQGEFANYSTSSFARKSTTLTLDELELIKGAKPLEDYLPSDLVPGESEQLVAAYRAAVAGDLFDTTKLTMVKAYPINKKK